MKICSVDGCEREIRCGGYCNAHYLRLLRRGTLERQRMDWSGATPEQVAERDRAWKKKEYENNRQGYLERAKKWQAENPDSYQKRKETYFSKEDVRERARERAIEWRENNKERKREQDKKFVEENPGLVASYKAMRRARARRAVPAWLTDDERAQIAALYDQCRSISESTGIPHQVDHIIPLAGKHVSGLHVLANLRIITAEENNRRKRIWNPLKDQP